MKNYTVTLISLVNPVRDLFLDKEPETKEYKFTIEAKNMLEAKNMAMSLHDKSVWDSYISENIL